jgi:uncharacterized protein involved in exopolysaccharide biosynthesis
MQNNELFVEELWRSIRSRFHIVLAAMISLGVLAGVAAFIMTPIYRATTLLAPVSEQNTNNSLGGLLNQFGGLASLAGLSLGSGTTNKDEAIAILDSRMFTIQFIDDNDLLPILFLDSWDAEAGNWLKPDDAPDLIDGYHLFSKIRTIAEDRQTGLVQMSVEWKDPHLAAAWANALIDRVNQVMRADAISDAERGIEYLNRELEKTSIVELRQAIFSLIEGQINRIMLANVRDEYAFRVLDPAMAPNKDDFVRPRSLLMVVMGLLIGGVLGVGVALRLHVQNKPSP